MTMFRFTRRFVFLSMLALLWPAEAHGTPTPVLPSPGEPDLTGDWNLVPPSAQGHEGILGFLYGWDNLTRVDDEDDRWWSFEAGAEASLRASWAGNQFDFGYLDTNGFHSILTHLSGATGYFALPARPLVSGEAANRLALGVFAGRFDSAQAEDHMVTFEVTGSASQYGRDYSANLVGSFVVGWEDLPFRMSDRDYNDFVLELRGVRPTGDPMAPIPEPASALLVGSGIAAMWIARRRRERRGRHPA
jgi:hypothetical protein